MIVSRLLPSHNNMCKTKYGDMLYNTHDMYIGKSLELYGTWADKEIELCLPHATGNVIDCGANIGTHTLAFASVAKTVFAFEPVRGLFTMLCANISLNELTNVVAERVAIGDVETWEHMGEPDFSQPQNLGGYALGTGHSKVQVVSLDRLEIPDVSLIKIDTEGYELKVLRGARETIKKWSPYLYIEVPFRNISKYIVDELDALSYDYEYREDPLGDAFPGVGHSYLLAWRKTRCLTD